MEKKLGTHDLEKRSNFGIFGMCVVNAWFAYKNSAEKDETQEDFYMYLAEEMIDNTYDIIRRRSRGTRAVAVVGGSPLISDDGRPRDAHGIHCTPMRVRKNTKDRHTAQLRCRICMRKTTNRCSSCDEPIVPLCSAKTGRDCFKQHFEDKHT